MRDPKRIPKVLAELQKLWEQYPDLRLGQLLVNLPFDGDPFFIEDDEMIKFLQEVQRQGI